MTTIRNILIASIVTLLFGMYPGIGHAAPVTYNFESDTIGQTPANTTVGAGTFDVQNDSTLGKSMRAVTQQGVIAAINFSDFTGSSDQSVVWKQAYSSTGGRGGFTLRSQAQDTGVANSAGAKKGYLFHVYDSSSVYIWRVDAGTYTMLWSGSLPKSQPRWFKSSAIGTQLSFSYSDDGVTYTSLATVTDSTYTSGLVQYTAGYGAAVNRDFIDNVVITNLDVPSVLSVDSTSADGSYKDGDTVHIMVKLSGPVTVTGSPFLNLNTGSIANYVSGSGTDTLIFDYYVWFGLNNSHLDVYQINLNGGTIVDSGNGANNADLSIASGESLGDHANIVIDNTAPTLVSAAITGTHEVTVTYSEVVSNNSSSHYTNFGGALAGKTIIGQSGNSGTDHIVLTFDGASLINQGGATMDISSSVVDLAGNAFAGAVSTAVSGVDTITSPIAVTLPTTGSSYATTGTMPLSFQLPEAMLSGSLSLLLAPTTGSPITVSLADVLPGTPVTITLNLADLGSSSGVVATSNAGLVQGTYSVVLSYQDALGNPATATTVAGVVVAVPAVVVQRQAGSVSGGSYGIPYVLPSAVPVASSISTVCPAEQLLTQNLRPGMRDGRRDASTGVLVTQAKILQAHLNRLGFNAGPVDGILGRTSKGAIKRMQSSLGTVADGSVGPVTRGLINNSCGSDKARPFGASIKAIP